jgi:hypothetical protein
MKHVIKLAVACVAVLVAATEQAQACHTTNVGSIDTIDHAFPDGGGVFNGSLLSGADESWMVFEATVGDNIVVSYTNPSSGGNKIGSVFIDIGDGNIQVGDGMNVSTKAATLSFLARRNHIRSLHPSLGSTASSWHGVILLPPVTAISQWR